MSIRDRLFTISGVIFCFFHISVSRESGAKLNELSTGTYCFKTGRELASLNLNYYESAIMISGLNPPMDCEIELWDYVTYREDYYVVISISEYMIHANDSVVMRDAEGTEVSLAGSGKFDKEEKSFLFKTPVTIRFIATQEFYEKKQIQFTFTAAHDLPCSSSEFQCSNGKCIPNRLVCDDHNSCGDLSDEQSCSTSPFCFSKEFRCDNGKCISYRKFCDSKDDCGDSSDEKICGLECKSYDFQCKNLQCISTSLVCDGNNNCGDMSDEIDCHAPCRPLEFNCRNSNCISAGLKCNKRDDCGDNSDEKDCDKPCHWNQFECSNRKCIPTILRCNEHNDCGDNSDETTCGWGDDVYESDERSLPIVLPIILSSVTIGIVLILLIVLSIRCCVLMRKKNKQSTQSSPSELQKPAPTSIIGRIRQSFRSHLQPTAPPLENVSATESAPPELQESSSSVIDRVRQSFRSNRQPTSQPVNTTSASNLRSGNTQVQPAIYPNLPTAHDFQGAENPVFKLEV